MRVVLAHKFHRLVGGAEMFFLEIDRVLRAGGHETLLISTGSVESDCDTKNIVVLEAPDFHSPRLATKLMNLPAAIYDLRKKRIVKDLLADFKPDVFHAFAVNVHLSPSIVVAASELGIPVVGSFNDYKHICPNYKMFHHQRICQECKGQRFYRALINRCCKKSLTQSAAGALEAYMHKWLGIYDAFDHFTFSSEFMSATTEQFWNGRKISWSTLQNPFNSSEYCADDVYGDFGLFFGRLVEEKGVDRLIRAAAYIDGFPIKVIGDGPEMPKLQALVKELGITNIEFLGPRWDKDLNSILRVTRFVVVPSTWHENFPYVINQAFALARPVIGSDRGGIPELVQQPERGLVFDPDNIKQLAECIRRLAYNEPEARRIGMAAKEWSDRTFHEGRAYEELMLAYEIARHENRSRRR